MFTNADDFSRKMFYNAKCWKKCADQKAVETAKTMLSINLPIDTILKRTQLPIDEVTALQEEFA